MPHGGGRPPVLHGVACVLIVLAGILAYFLPRRLERSALREFQRGGKSNSTACHGCAEVE